MAGIAMRSLQLPGPVVVTGARGFIGRALCRHLLERGCAVRAVVRAAPEHGAPALEYHALGNLEDVHEERLQTVLAGAFAVIHLAGRAHVLEDRAVDPEAAYEAANVNVTERIAKAAVRARVERFVFASTVKVNGERTATGHPFRPDDDPAPRDAYGRSKLAAERASSLAFQSSSTAPLVLRLPLVYGPGVRGNFARLLDLVGAERALPLASIDNRRSLLFVGNLAEAIAAGLAMRAPPQGVHFVADADAVSTPELVRAIAAALHTRARLFPVPVALLRAAAALVGRSGELDRLAGSLEVDARSLRDLTGWQPRYTLTDGLRETAAWWRTRHSI